MQLTVQQPDLSQMFGQDSLFSTLYGMNRANQANANNAQNLEQAQQDQSFQADMHPLDMAAAQANIGHTQALTGLTTAQTPGAQADSNTKVRNDADAASVDPIVRRQALISKIAAGTTEDDLKKHVAQATMDLTATNPDGSPDIGRRRDAQLVISTAPELQSELAKVRAQGDNAARVANIQGSNQLALERQQAADGRWNKNTMEYLKFQANAKANFQQQAGIARQEASEYQASADAATDPDQKKYFESRVAQAKKDYDTAVANDYAARTAPANTANAAKPNTSTLLGVNPVSDPNSVPKPPMAPAIPTGPLPAVNPKLPKPGDTVKGFRFKGGNPGDKNNWEKV